VWHFSIFSPILYLPLILETMKFTDEQRALLAERLANRVMEDIDPVTLERMVYDSYLDEYIMLDDEDLLLEAEVMGVEVPSVVVV
jgi:hypothetical protein